MELCFPWQPNILGLAPGSASCQVHRWCGLLGSLPDAVFPSQKPSSLFLGLQPSYKTTLANLGVGSFAFVAMEESACPIVLCQENDINSFSFPLSLNMAENPEECLACHTWAQPGKSLVWEPCCCLWEVPVPGLCFLFLQNNRTFGSVKPLSWVATQTLPVSCCHFLAVNNQPTLPRDALLTPCSWQPNQPSKSRCTAGVILLGTQAGHS